MKIDVAIPRTKVDVFTYTTSEELEVGDLVLVPLRNAVKHGIVVNAKSSRSVKGLRKITEIVEKKFLPYSLIQLYTWIAEYYIASRGEVLRLALPAKLLKATPAISEQTVSDIKTPSHRPTVRQDEAIRQITDALQKKIFRTFLLFGITGSGKTEVYLRSVKEALNLPGRALVLVPEIAMTPLLFTWFHERFGNEVATIHSSLTEKERRLLWYGIKQGKYRIVIGPRSSVFLPIPDLRIIIVDEEHDHSYKEHERTPHYNARDVAVMRGKIENCPVVLGSATPQIESYHNVEIGKYHLLKLPERIDKRSLPQVELIDLKEENRKFISPKLQTEIEKTLTAGKQSIIFLNRRGFSPQLICPDCGFIARCPHCQLPLVYHKATKAKHASLCCHVCGHNAKKISICPKCSRSTLLYRGAGTQRIEDFITTIVDKIPDAKADENTVVRLDSDSVRRKGQVEKVFHQFSSGEAKILLGTQLVTKGFDFPLVTLVGIVNADLLLNIPDFRSSERTFQMLTQVAGRSGRGSIPGSVLMQTYHPEQYAILFSQLQDYPSFYASEKQMRKELDFPPFSRLILIRLKGEQEEKVWKEAERVALSLQRMKNITLYGPNRSFYYKIRNMYRVFILIKIPVRFPHKKLHFLRSVKLVHSQLDIDVDPLDVL